jgi:DNA polymerase III delta subunit
MLALIYGTDQLKRAGARDATIALAQKKNPDLEVTSYNALDKTRAEIEESLYATNLFGVPRMVVIANLSEHEEAPSFFLALLKEVSERNDITLLAVEEKLKKDILSKYEKYTDTISLYDLPKRGENEEKRNPFALSDAVYARDKKLVWKLYREAIDGGASEEEIAGMLFWSLKSLMLAAKEKTAADAGVHPFVYGKAKRALSKWSEADLTQTTDALVRLVHENRSLSFDPEISLEQFLLSKM